MRLRGGRFRRADPARRSRPRASAPAGRRLRRRGIGRVRRGSSRPAPPCRRPRCRARSGGRPGRVLAPASRTGRGTGRRGRSPWRRGSWARARGRSRGSSAPACTARMPITPAPAALAAAMISRGRGGVAEAVERAGAVHQVGDRLHRLRLRVVSASAASIASGTPMPVIPQAPILPSAFRRLHRRNHLVRVLRQAVATWAWRSAPWA